MLDVPEDVLKELSPYMLPYLEEIRARDFPLLDKLDRAYLDNAAMAQVPDSVKDQMYSYRKSRLRGSNHGSESDESREMHLQYDLAKSAAREFFGAGDNHIAFTSGTTEGANNIAARLRIERGDLLLVTNMEHNSNMLTAINFARMKGADIVESGKGVVITIFRL